MFHILKLFCSNTFYFNFTYLKLSLFKKFEFSCSFILNTVKSIENSNISDKIESI